MGRAMTNERVFILNQRIVSESTRQDRLTGSRDHLARVLVEQTHRWEWKSRVQSGQAGNFHSGDEGRRRSLQLES
jgi:hypothetical protein